ncbi:MAG TPA: radical SAM protein, partial [Candidatus Binatia bacterium]|nr:radical SAM protein [Candidatus Binatia bacterium]
MRNIARSVGAGAALLPHQRFTAEGEAYVYAAETGGLFRMDDGVRDALSVLASAKAEEVPAEVLSDLRRAGLLGTATGCGPVGRTAHPPLRLRTLVLLLTTSCNLACRYCYEDREEGCASAGDGRGGPGAAAGGGTPREMSLESLRGGVAYLLEHAGAGRKVSVTFFGGEPLLRFPLIRSAVGEARRMATERGKEISFSITTNGTLLTRETAGFLKENGISVCLSIDGPREIHDRNRPYASGRGSYEDVARGIELLMENRNGFPVAARVTLGRGAVDVRKTFDHLRGLGFDEVGFAPASAAEGSPSALTEEELCAVMEGFRDLADGYVDDVR